MRILSPLIAISMSCQAALACTTDAMIVFDGSASMAEITLETRETTRIVEARRAMRLAMPLVEEVRRIGLLTYGPGPDGACDGITLRFPPRPLAGDAIVAAVDALVPNGLTPLSAAVEQAAEALSYRSQSAIVVLVTDGNETCGGTPCATSRRMASVSADLTIHVIGFRATRDFFAWDNPEQQEFGGDTVAKCFADRTGGLFVSTETVDELVTALQATLGCMVVGGRTAAVAKLRG
ncbi:VWA domain-containing protein [Jannaschia sp. 2305UL9-9]|uniref:vWA domain-containing protein n=1 Tax=Jannaschia sp. 2305UL9-9 TaxID=3121638 RepID=UPI0035294EC2